MFIWHVAKLSQPFTKSIVTCRNTESILFSVVSAIEFLNRMGIRLMSNESTTSKGSRSNTSSIASSMVSPMLTR